MYNNYLYHHGIKGQHWGVRRFQNEDGSLTDAGRKRYYSSDVDGANKNLSNAKADYKKAVGNYYKTTGGMIYNQKATKDLTDSAKKLNWAKEDLKDEKVKTKLNAETKVSKRRTALEEEYKKKGMTDEEAAVAAYKREKTEKILAATLGVTVAAAAAYSAYKYHDYAFDKVIPAGTSIQNISGFANRGVEDAFYAASAESDKTRYKGWYGKQMMDRYGQAHLSNFTATKDARIASDKNANKVLRNLMNTNSAFRSNVENSIRTDMLYDANRRSLYEKALSDINKGKISNSVYQAVNAGLVGRDPRSTEIKNTFYDELKKAGYAGIMDTNDRKKAFFKTAVGYNTKSPMIIFDGANHFKTNGSRQLLGDEIIRNHKKATADFKRELAVVGGSKLAAYGAAGAGAVGATKYLSNKNNDKIVAKYRKEHPETQLSYKEILRMQQGK